jgi:hypothetical protein
VKDLRADGTLTLLAILNLVKDLERPQFGIMWVIGVKGFMMLRCR